MKRLPLVAAGLALVVGVGAVAITSSFIGTANDDAVPVAGEVTTDSAPVAAPQPAPEPEVQLAQTTTESDDTESKEEDKPMSEDTATEAPKEQSEAFKQTMHEGDVALGVCGARVSALLWFYEASVAQGRDDLKGAVESLTSSRETIKTEAERRAVEDKVDTSVRVMNDESERMWNDLNEKAGGDGEEFQKAHDELLAGVQECLSMFFDRPDGEKSADAKSE